MDARRLVAIGIGAVVGGALRWVTLRGLDVDPYLALLAVNTPAAALLGWVRSGVLAGRRWRGDLVELLGAGLCGTLSTWSALALQLSDDLRSGRIGVAVFWTVASVAAGVAAAIAGSRLAARRISGPPAPPVEQVP